MALPAYNPQSFHSLHPVPPRQSNAFLLSPHSVPLHLFFSFNVKLHTGSLENGDMLPKMSLICKRALYIMDIYFFILFLHVLQLFFLILKTLFRMSFTVHVFHCNCVHACNFSPSIVIILVLEMWLKWAH